MPNLVDKSNLFLMDMIDNNISELSVNMNGYDSEKLLSYNDKYLQILYFIIVRLGDISLKIENVTEYNIVFSIHYFGNHSYFKILYNKDFGFDFDCELISVVKHKAKIKKNTELLCWAYNNSVEIVDKLNGD